MEKADVNYRYDVSPPGTVTPDGHQHMEYRTNGTALSARQRLSSQPTNETNDPNDPVSFLAAIGGLNTASINPAYGKPGKELWVSKIMASYQTTTAIVVNSIDPSFWIPFANKYGRRPIYLGTTLLGFGSILACAYTKTFGQLIAARVFNGFFPVAFALGTATVVDLFFYHQRGRAMGFFTITMTSGSHWRPSSGASLANT